MSDPIRVTVTVPEWTGTIEIPPELAGDHTAMSREVHRQVFGQPDDCAGTGQVPFVWVQEP